MTFSELNSLGPLTANVAELHMMQRALAKRPVCCSPWICAPLLFRLALACSSPFLQFRHELSPFGGILPSYILFLEAVVGLFFFSCG